jgi:hypothetical protein
VKFVPHSLAKLKSSTDSSSFESIIVFNLDIWRNL